MTSLNTKNICFLAAFLFLSIVPTLAEVVGSVADCDQFLHEKTPPHIPDVLEDGKIQNQNRYKVICQTYKDVRRYLTVYDTVNKIPVFSAYEYKGSVPGRCQITWMTEPQLDENPTKENINMRKQGRNIKYQYQAVDADYNEDDENTEPMTDDDEDAKTEPMTDDDEDAKTEPMTDDDEDAKTEPMADDDELDDKNIKKKVKTYDRGHLFPANHASKYKEQISTFTLTNVVPQHLNFNRGRWKTMETTIKEIMDQRIKDKIKCFVVVGAQPGDNFLNNKKSKDNTSKNKVNIPKMMWSAFHCTDGESHAYWDDNIKRKPGSAMQKGTLQQLQGQLDYTNRNLRGVVVFPQNPKHPRSGSLQQLQDSPPKLPRSGSLPSSIGKS